MTALVAHDVSVVVLIVVLVGTSIHGNCCSVMPPAIAVMIVGCCSSNQSHSTRQVLGPGDGSYPLVLALGP